MTGGHVLNARTAIQYVAGDLRAMGGDKIQFRQKIVVRAQYVYEVMLLAAGRVEVPEGLARQFLHGAEIPFRLPAHIKAHPRHLLCSIILLRAPKEKCGAGNRVPCPAAPFAYERLALNRRMLCSVK